MRDASPKRTHRSEGASVMAMRLPRHIGFIPDGNRRWAQAKGLPKEDGYGFGIEPGLALFEMCSALRIEEVSIYGFTQDNTRRPAAQTEKFSAACVGFAKLMCE